MCSFTLNLLIAFSLIFHPKASPVLMTLRNRFKAHIRVLHIPL